MLLKFLAGTNWRENFGAKKLAGKFWRENNGGKVLAPTGTGCDVIPDVTSFGGKKHEHDNQDHEERKLVLLLHY